MWKVEDALPGRLSMGKGHNGGLEKQLILELDGKRVYQLQKYLEEQIGKGGEFFTIRLLVLLHEELRQAVALAQGNGGWEKASNGSPTFQRAESTPERSERGDHHPA